jgi:hypothetical protein
MWKALTGVSWNALAKGAAIAAVCIGAGWTVWTYVDTSTRESKRPFLEKQFDVYAELIDVAATIAVAPVFDDSMKAKRDRFNALEWGQLGVVGSEEVQLAAIGFGKLVEQYAASAWDQGERSELQKASQKIAHEVRCSIESGWGTKIGRAIESLAVENLHFSATPCRGIGS